MISVNTGEHDTLKLDNAVKRKGGQKMIDVHDNGQPKRCKELFATVFDRRISVEISSS